VSVTAARGFSASGIFCGIKESGALDLALVTSISGPVPAAATFTTNKAAAAPVVVSRDHLIATEGHATGVILNSGCANAATGEAGHRAAVRTADALGEALGVDPTSVLVCSTGLIGPHLPLEKILSGIPVLVGERSDSTAGGDAAATAILTTDTHPKQVVIDGGGFTVGGMVKGAGMIAPNMATMLAVLTTDASRRSGGAAMPRSDGRLARRSTSSSSTVRPRRTTRSSFSRAGRAGSPGRRSYSATRSKRRACRSRNRWPKMPKARQSVAIIEGGRCRRRTRTHDGAPEA
jgi:hypothetical protein